jgi:membrane fusion protein (multidrug efflux system)
MNKRILLTVLVALGVLGAIFGFKYLQLTKAKAALAARRPAPAAVTTAPAVAEQWRNTLHAVGSLESFQGVTLRSEIEGRIVRVAFESGARVAAGDVLVELDTAAEAAQLRSNEATARLAELNLQRARELRQTNANTQADLDAAEATAPRPGPPSSPPRPPSPRSASSPPSPAGSASVRSTRPVPQQGRRRRHPRGHRSHLRRLHPAPAGSQRTPTGLAVQVTIDAFPDREFTGRIEAIDPRVSTTTRNLRARATLPNPDEALRPGMFARVEVQLPGAQVIVLPATAIVYSPYGDSVYVVAEGRARVRSPRNSAS